MKSEQQPTSGDTTESAGALLERRPSRMDVHTLQTPADVKIRIYAGVTDIIKAVTTGRMPRGRYEINTEYWQYNHIASLDADRLEMEITDLLRADDEKEVESFLSGMTAAFSHPPIGPVWKVEKRLIPPGRTGYLYSMDDLDGTGSGRKMGLLFEVEDGKVKAISWYKTWTPPDGMITDAFPRTVILTRVRNGGQPSTDPSHIVPGVSWCHTLMGAQSDAT